MYFRMTFLVAALLGLVSCTVNLGEKPAPVQAHQLGSTKCLSEVSPTMGNFVRGDAKDVEIEKLWNCIDTAIDTFNRYVRGADTGLYTSQEIATFLENNFLEPGSVLSASLQLEIMRIKTLLVGGNTSHISRQELDRLKSVLVVLRGITLDLNPHMKTFVLTWKSKNARADSDYLKQASAVFLESLKTLAQVFDKNSQGYRFADFVNLCKEMGLFLNESWSFPQTLQQYLPVIKKVKKALTGGDEELIAADEWQQIATLSGRGYSLYLHWFYLVRDNPQEKETNIAYVTRALDEVFSIFAEIVMVKKTPVVSQAEIAELLGSIEGIWPEFKVSPELVRQAMKFKVTLLGGKEDVITPEEFSLGRKKIQAAQSSIEKIYEHLPLIMGNWELDRLSFARARDLFMGNQKEILASVSEISRQIEGSYDLLQLEPLIKEALRLYPSLESGFLSELRRNLKFIVELKKMFWGGDSSIQKNQWTPIVESISQGYAASLQYRYFVSRDRWGLSSQDKSWLDLLDTGFNLVEKLVVSKKSQVLNKDETKMIVQYLMTEGYLPKLSTRSLDRTLDIVFNNILVSPERRLKGAKPQVLNQSALAVAKTEIKMFFETQAFLSQWRDTWGNLVARGGGVVYNHFESEINKKSNSQELRLALREMSFSVSTVLPLTLDAHNRVTITNRKELFYSLDSLRGLNVYRAFSRVLMRSFGGSTSRIQNYQGVTLKETETAYGRVFPVVVELGFVEKDSYSFASSRFREANMFMPHSDGNELVSFVELVDLMAMIWSGLNVDGLVKKDIERGCFNGRKMNSQTLIPMKCLVNVYYNSMQRHLSSSPEYVRYTASIPTETWALYIHNIFKAAGYVPNAQMLAKAGDVALAPHIMQYIELLYARYDKNKNDRIETEEALVAYHAFKSILKQLAAKELSSGSLKESDLPSLFTYIIKHGKPPESTTEKIAFAMNWRGKPSKWNLQSTRLELATILGYIADQTNKVNHPNFAD